MYDDPVYANSRLAETYAYSKTYKQLVYINFIDVDTFECSCEIINKGSFKLPLEDLDFMDLKLGYVNLRDDCSYFSRIPKRKDWRQGLRQNNTIWDKPLMRIKFTVDCIKGISNTLNNKYPSYENCIEKIKEGKKKSIAFSREFALNDLDNVGLLYKSKQIATLSKQDEMIFDFDYLYLKDRFNRVLENEKNN